MKLLTKINKSFLQNVKCKYESDTFAGLQQFYKEEEYSELIKLSLQECTKPEEDWNLSQFWYGEQMSEILAKACVRRAGLTGEIACMSVPIQKAFSRS